jgi:NhaC family Na+:H+ antiporter
MSVSIITAILVCVFIQKINYLNIIRFMFFGFSANDQTVALMLNGGGIISMTRVMAIVCISSAYAGIFQKTGLLDTFKKMIINVNKKITSYGGILITAIITSLITCSQTLTIILTHQLNHDIEKDNQKLAIDLEDSAVVIPPLVPWSIAAAVPLTSIGASNLSILAAFFLYLLPLCRFIIYNHSKNKGVSHQSKDA